MRLSRQSLLGLVMLFGGIIMLFAMIKQVQKPEIPEEQTVELTPVESADGEQANTLEPLTTTDLDKEAQLLAQKQQEREAIIAQQEARAKELLRQQEVAEAHALEKARRENEEFRSAAAEPINDIETEVTRPTVVAREETTKVTTSVPATPVTTEKANTVNNSDKASTPVQEAMPVQPKATDVKVAEKPEPATPKRTGTYTVQKGESLSVIANTYNVPITALAQANKLTATSGLQVGQTLKIPSDSQIKRLQADAAYLESKRQAEAKQKAEAEQRKAEQQAALERKSTEARQTAQQKLNAARQQVKETDAKGTFGVQVALASDQQKADEIASKFKSAGYPVKTSQTDKGVRVLVGPERGKVAAVALKDKINSDPRVNTTSAWVLYWR